MVFHWGMLICCYTKYFAAGITCQHDGKFVSATERSYCDYRSWFHSLEESRCDALWTCWNHPSSPFRDGFSPSLCVKLSSLLPHPLHNSLSIPSLEVIHVLKAFVKLSQWGSCRITKAHKTSFLTHILSQNPYVPWFWFVQQRQRRRLQHLRVAAHCCNSPQLCSYHQTICYGWR